VPRVEKLQAKEAPPAVGLKLVSCFGGIELAAVELERALRGMPVPLPGNVAEGGGNAIR
jgi:hypothetical protein